MSDAAAKAGGVAAGAANGSDRHLAERTLDSRPVYRGSFFELRKDSVVLPDGSTGQREYIVHPGAVMVVPLLDHGRLLLERQWRHPMGRAMLEFPAGKLDAGESPFHCAMRELKEETGYRATEWARAGILHNAIAYSTEGIEIWFARGLIAGASELDAGEFLELAVLTHEQLDAGVARGEVTDAKTVIGLLWLQRWLAGHWPLTWQPAASL